MNTCSLLQKEVVTNLAFFARQRRFAIVVQDFAYPEFRVDVQGAVFAMHAKRSSVAGSVLIEYLAAECFFYFTLVRFKQCFGAGDYCFGPRQFKAQRPETLATMRMPEGCRPRESA